VSAAMFSSSGKYRPAQAKNVTPKLYLNPVLSKLGTQIFRVLMMDGVHSQAARAFEVQGAIINEETLLRRALGDFEGDAKDGFLGLAGTDVAGAEEDEEIAAKIECFDAELVQFEGLVVDGADEVAAGISEFVQNGASFGEFLRLGKHESGKFFTSEGARAKEQGTVEIFVKSDEAAVEGGKRELMTVLKFLPIQVKSGRSFFSRTAIPAVGENDSADVPEEGCDWSQG
jgi:hypothetical protein